MKYLKTYEKKFGYFNDDLKKYIVIKTKNKYYELYKIDIEEYICALLKIYNIKTNFQDTNLKNNNFNKISNIIDFNNEILFLSDNLDEALDYFDMLLNIKKYNI